VSHQRAHRPGSGGGGRIASRITGKPRAGGGHHLGGSAGARLRRGGGRAKIFRHHPPPQRPMGLLPSLGRNGRLAATCCPRKNQRQQPTRPNNLFFRTARTVGTWASPGTPLLSRSDIPALRAGLSPGTVNRSPPLRLLISALLIIGFAPNGATHDIAWAHPLRQKPPVFQEQRQCRRYPQAQGAVQRTTARLSVAPMGLPRLIVDGRFSPCR